ncbi:MAG TPA: hypothetical protein VFT22_34625 [Kofleriaceae bacterium]|nr:hypothetical protein [Kofleriaceae bacterium]
MTTRTLLEMVSLGIACAGLAAAGCAAAVDGPADPGDGVVLTAELVPVEAPSGTLQASVVEIASSADLLDAVTSHDNVYIHALADHAWYFKSGNYLLGIEAFTQYQQELDAWIDFGTGDKVAPAKARVVGHSPRGEGWQIPSLEVDGQWPAPINSVWVIGTEGGKFGMGGAPQGIPLGTEVFGSMQTYGGALSTPYLEFDVSPRPDSARIRALFGFRGDTLIGGHSAGSTAARRIALDVGLDHVWLYGTPNYSRGSGAYEKTETSGSHRMVAEVINNDDDPVTNVLVFPFKLVSLAWGTAKCHNYSGWDYENTSPVTVVCQ